MWDKRDNNHFSWENLRWEIECLSKCIDKLWYIYTIGCYMYSYEHEQIVTPHNSMAECGGNNFNQKKT